MKTPTFRLKDGYDMPVLGIGTWQLVGENCEKLVRQALEMGYEHIDTSDDYMNEEEIGRAIEGFDRTNIFITSKAGDLKLRKNDLIKACEESLRKLSIAYLDLYLVQRPNPVIPIRETMEGMEELVRRKLVRSFGVSNFNTSGAQAAIESSRMPVCVNQVKIHTYHYPADLIEFCKANGMVLVAYSPLDTGGLVEDELLGSIGRKYGKTAAQVSLRWLVGKGLSVIPKPDNEYHLRENMDIFDWHLSREDEERISQLAYSALRG